MTPPSGSATSGALRQARGCAFAAAAAWLAAVAHVGAGGTAPSVIAVLLVTALCGAVGVNLSARRAGFARVTLTLAPVQAAAHLLYQIFGERGATGGPSGHHAHHAMTAGAGQAGSGAGSAPSDGNWHMLALHGLAVLATALLLTYGERAVWRLVSWLTAVLVVSRTAPGAVGALARLAVRSPHEVVPVVREGRSGASRRGPPVVAPAR